VFEIENIVIVVKNGWWKGIRLEGVGVVNVEVFLTFFFSSEEKR
jgi:hypothetical protein